MGDWIDNSPPSGMTSNTVLSGYLRRSSRAGKTLGLRQKRFYKLDGAIFSKHLTENSHAIWDINVQGAQIGRVGRCNFGIRLNNLEKRAAKDFHNNLIILYARTEEECNVWVAALRNASQRKIEDYYEVMEVIGEGGFAKVRLGRCLTTNQKRAIKTMNKAEAHAKVLGTEVAVIKRVNHPNIVKTFDVFETADQIHIVMEFMEGGMLYDSIEDGVQFDEHDVIQFMRELLDGVLYLHEMGIVHRDLKPENVLCTSKRTPLHVKIADFGLSSISTVADAKANRMLMSTMIGTPEFVAPEIARNETYTEKVDMWAMGMLCYNVIAGRLPLDESRDMIEQIQEGITVSFPEPEWNRFSPQARSFVRSLLCPNPEKRLSPLGCLVHRWVETVVPEQSTKFAAHGRMSNILFAPTVQQMRVMQKYRAFNVKKTWRKLFLSVTALCKISNLCGYLKMFETAKFRAVSLFQEHRPPALTCLTKSHDYISDSSDASLRIQSRLVSTATSNSTTAGDEEPGRRNGSDDGGGAGTNGRIPSVRMLGYEPAKVGTPNTDSNNTHSPHPQMNGLAPSLQISHSVDLDLRFDDDDLVDGDSAPNSLNWKEKGGANSVVIEPQPLSTRVLRFQTWIKNRGISGANRNTSKADLSDPKSARKLNQMLTKAMRNGHHGNGSAGTGSSTPNGTNSEKSEKHNNVQNIQLEQVDFADEHGGSFGTSSTALSTPWRSSESVASVGNGAQTNKGKNVHPNKHFLRKKLLHPFTGDPARTNSGHNASRKVKGEGAMNKIRMFMRKADVSRNGSNHDHDGKERNLTKSKTLQFAGVDSGKGDGAVNQKGRGDLLFDDQEEHDEHDMMLEAGVRTIDVAHLKHLYSEEANTATSPALCAKTMRNETIAAHQNPFCRTGSGPANNFQVDGVGAASFTNKGMPNNNADKHTQTSMAGENPAMNRISPLTPSMDGSRAGFRK